MNKPDRAFFESNERSARLRSICLVGTAALEAMTLGEDSAVGALLDSIRDLHTLGIVSNMHTIAGDDPQAAQKREAMMSNPVVSTEWVSGQLLNFVERSEVFGPVDLSRLEEHDELLGEGEGVALFKSDADPALTDLAFRLGFYGTINMLLDHDPSEQG